MRLTNSVKLRYNTRLSAIIFIILVITLPLSAGAAAAMTAESGDAQSSPVADFEVTPSEIAPDEEIELDASISDSAEEINSYDWAMPSEWSGPFFPSGETVTGSFDSYGEYEVELEVTDINGRTDTVTKTIAVDAPTAAFEITPSDPDPDEDVEFDATASETGADLITDYEWTMPDDWSGSAQSTGENITGSFAQPGEYEVELEITDSDESTDSTTKAVQVGGEGPTADFEKSVSTLAPTQEVVFDASASTTTAGEIETYEWEYETVRDDESSAGESFSHAFEGYGEFEITLTVTDEFDRHDSVTKSVEVRGDGPTAEFEFSPSNPGLNDRIVFDGSVSTASDLAIEEYRWFVNGEPEASGSELATTFDETDVYNVELEVENTGGKTDRISKTVPVGNVDEVYDNPDFELLRSSPESESVSVRQGERVSFASEIESEGIPDATESFFVDGTLHQQAAVDSKSLRTNARFNELGHHTVEIEVKGVAGNAATVKWDVTAHNFNSLPTVAEQSSSETISLDGETEILTFSIQNPTANEREIEAEIVAELPDGVSISAASGVSTGDAAIQTTSETISPGNQESMRLDVAVEDESLEGQQLTIPYQVRYQPIGGEDVIYTPNEQELEVVVGNMEDDEERTDDESPGFGIVSVIIGIGLLVVGRHTYRSLISSSWIAVLSFENSSLSRSTSAFFIR